MDTTPLLAAKVFSSFTVYLLKFNESMFYRVTESLGGWMIAVTTLYLVITGLAMMSGHLSKGVVRQVATSMVLVALLHSILMERHGFLYGMIYAYKSFVFDLCDFFTITASTVVPENAIANTDSLKLFTRLDAALWRLLRLLIDHFPQISIRNFGQYIFTIVGLLILFLAFLCSYLCFIITMSMGYFAIIVLFTIGAPCIFFASFDKTRFIFWSWFRAIINYSLILVFASIIMSLAMQGIETGLVGLIESNITITIANSDFILGLVWSCLAFAMLLKAPDFAAALSGGSAGSSAGIAGSLSVAGGAAITGGIMAARMAKPQNIVQGFQAVRSGAGQVGRGFNRLGVYGHRAYSAMKGIGQQRQP